MTAVEKMVAACESLGLAPQEKGGWWRAKHPCSPDGDSTKSYAFKECGDGTVLVRSHKPSYTNDDCLRVLGMTWAECFPETDKRYAGGKVVHGYEYPDKGGRLVGQIGRTTDKNFIQSRYEKGRLKAGLDGQKLPLYLAPMIHQWKDEGKPIFLVEGEKDVRALCREGYASTTKPGGAKSPWTEENVLMLNGADIIIVADKDEAGTAGAIASYKELLPVAKSIRIVEAKEGKDAYDHLAAGLDVAEFVARDDMVPTISSTGKAVTCIDWTEVGDYSPPRGVPTGFKNIDSRVDTKGFPRGQMTVWAARKKVGKTAGMLQCAINACEEWNRVLYVLMADLTPQQARARVYRQLSGWSEPPHDLAKADDWHRMVAQKESFYDLRFATSQSLGGRTIEDVVPGVRALHDRWGFDIVFMDYVQKIESSRERDRVRALERVSKDLSDMAEDDGFVLVAGSQLSAAGMTRYSQEFEDDCGMMVVVSAPDGLDPESCPARRFDVPLCRFGPSGWGFDGEWVPSRLCFSESPGGY